MSFVIFPSQYLRLLRLAAFLHFLTSLLKYRCYLRLSSHLFRVLFSPFWSHTNPWFPLFILSCLLRPQCCLTSLIFFFWASDLPFVVFLDKLFKCLSFCYLESIDSKLNCFLHKFNNSSLISLLILMTLSIFLGSQSSNF